MSLFRRGAIRGGNASPSVAAQGIAGHRLEEDAVVILDIFSKKTTRTPKAVLDVCKARLKRYLKTAKED